MCYTVTAQSDVDCLRQITTTDNCPTIKHRDNYRDNQPPQDSCVFRIMSQPPPLPPRAASIHLQSVPDEDPPEYEEFYHQPLEHSWSAQDPRSKSTQSLVPTKDKDNESKRTLLLIYIHGFMGNETSFQSFPAHVHNVVTVALAETHVIHTKIYPKYKSRRAVEYARDDFSEWYGYVLCSLPDCLGGSLAADDMVGFALMNHPRRM